MQLQIILTVIFGYLMGILQASKNACQLVEIEPNEVIFQSNQLLFESSQKDFQNVGQNNYSLITEIVKIPNRFEGRLISSLVIESINIGSKFGKLFCQLIKHQDYFINCIRDINFYGDGNEQFDFSNSFTVNLPIDQAEVCEEFFHQNFVEFLIFCFDNNYLKIHNDKCRKKYFQKDLNYFFIAFYQCSFWGIVSIKDYLISDILNKYSFQNFVNVSETNIYNVQFCNQQKYSQIGLYLIIENGYFELIIDDQQVVQNYLQFYEQDVKSREIIFGQYCQIVLNIIHLQSSNKTKIQQESFSDEFEGTPLDIQLFYEALFVQYQNELLVIYNKYFRQNIKINDSHFVFYDNFNLIQQVDQISKQIYIYKFSFPRNILKPSKQYIYLTSSQFRSQIQTVDCIEVKKVVPLTIGQFKIIIFENQCQKQVDFLYSKAGLYNQQDLKEFYQNETLLKISDRITISQICPMIQKIKNLNNLLMYYFYFNEQPHYISKLDNSYHIQNCFSTSYTRINIDTSVIFSYQNHIVQVQKERRFFKFIRINGLNRIVQEMKVKSQVLSMIQFQELLLVFTQDYQDSCIMNIKFARVFFYEDMFKILYQIFYQEILEKDKIENDQTEAFFYQQNNPSFIQYQQQIIAIRNKKYNTYKTNNIQIIILKLMIKDFYYFLGLHLYNNDIIEHYFDLEQISIFNNYTLLGYELIRPLKYEIQNQYLAIGIKNGSDKFIQVFEIYFTKPFKLINVIQISKQQFFFKDYQLFFYDMNDQISVLDIKHFSFSFQNPFIQQNNSINQKNFSIQVTFQNSSPTTIEFGLKSYNYCYKLFLLKDYLNVFQKQQIIRKIDDYIQGPIDELKVLDNDKVKVDGPILLSQDILHDRIEGILMSKRVSTTSSILSNNNIKIFLIQFENYMQTIIFNIYQKQPLNSQHFNAQILEAIHVSELEILFVYYFQQENETLIGAIHSIENENNSHLNPEPIKLIKVKLEKKIYDYSVQKTGNTILFQTFDHCIIFLYNENSIQAVQFEKNYQKVLKLNTENDFYISFSFLDSEMINIEVLRINQQKIFQMGSTLLNQMSITNELEKFIKVSSKLQISPNNTFWLEGYLNEDKIRVIILQIFSHYSLISYLDINLQDFSSSYKVIKLFRNSVDSTELTFQYYDKNILMLKSSSNFIYVYDLNSQKKFNDYIGKFDQCNFTFQNFNTTHILIYSQDLDKLYFGEIGYQIEYNDQYIKQQTNKLVAKNSVSQVQLNLILEIEDLEQERLIVIFVFFSLSILGILILFCFLKRRQNLKQMYNNLNKQINDSQSKQIKELQI